MVNALEYVDDNFSFSDLLDFYYYFKKLDKTGTADKNIYFKNACSTFCKYYNKEYDIDFFRKATMQVLLNRCLDKLDSVSRIME